jgi:hypothetical protein
MAGYRGILFWIKRARSGRKRGSAPHNANANLSYLQIEIKAF